VSEEAERQTFIL